jgi:hypothetical protein
MKLVQISVLAFASLATALPSFGLGSRGLTVCTPQGNGGGDTENGIKNGNCCTDVTIVFARGTTEAGNVGGVAGPPLFKALRNKIGAGRVTVQGTAYPADFAVSQCFSLNELSKLTFGTGFLPRRRNWCSSNGQ